MRSCESCRHTLGGGYCFGCNRSTGFHKWEPKPMTNGDVFRSMNNYDLADWIAKVLMYHGLVERHPYLNCDKNCPLYKCCNDQPTDNIEGWLDLPAEVSE